MILEIFRFIVRIVDFSKTDQERREIGKWNKKNLSFEFMERNLLTERMNSNLQTLKSEEILLFSLKVAFLL